MGRMRMLGALCALGALVACGDKADEGSDTSSADDGGNPWGDADGADGGSGDGGSGDGGDGGSGDGGDDGTAVFAPKACHWTITGGDLIYDNCQAEGELPATEGDGFVHTNTSETSFSWVFDATGDSVNCNLATDQSYVCDLMTGSEDIPDWDVTITSQVAIAGTYGDDRTSGGQWDIVVDCSGGDCWLAEIASGVSFPCDVAVTVSAAAD